MLARPWLGFFVTTFTVALGTGSAWADSAPANPPELTQEQAAPHLPQLELRGWAGLQPGAEVDLRLGDRWRVGGEQRLAWPGLSAAPYTTDLALHRQVGPSTSILWVRAGYQYQHVQQSCWDRTGDFDDNAHAVDLGLELRRRTARGHLLQADLGLEHLWRSRALGCNDSGVGASSTGLRLGLLGQLALTRHLGLFGRLGLRTAEHLLEIDFLPQAEIGLAVEL